MASFDHLQEGDRGLGRDARFAFSGRCLEYFVSTECNTNTCFAFCMLWQVKREKVLCWHKTPKT